MIQIAPANGYEAADRRAVAQLRSVSKAFGDVF
jgi:hypothetical protein